MAPSFRSNGASLVAIALALALGLGSCREIGIAADVVFPSTVPGLPAHEPWESLPLRRWLTESSLEPVAISVCYGCAEPAVVGLFRARGADVVRIRTALGRPGSLLEPSGKRTRIRPGRARIATEGAPEGGLPGAMMVATGRRGKQAAVYGLMAERGDTASVVVIVARSREVARRLARGIAPRLGG